MEDPHITWLEKAGMLVENLNQPPKGDQSGRGSRFKIWPLKYTT